MEIIIFVVPNGSVWVRQPVITLGSSLCTYNCLDTGLQIFKALNIVFLSSFIVITLTCNAQNQVKVMGTYISVLILIPSDLNKKKRNKV